MSHSENVAGRPDDSGAAPQRRLHLGRRGFLRLAGGAVVATSVPWSGKVLRPQLADAADLPPDLVMGGTDGWMYLPKTPAIAPFHPDNLAPSPFTTYIFGFRNITGLSAVQRNNQKNHAQHSAPLLWLDEYDPADPKEFRIELTNLGLAVRPDLFDAHTLHWHGFRNVIPFFDGEPTGSVSVPTGSSFTYAYRPRDAGTYMYHCHVEDVEHVHMGMTGLVFVRPKGQPKRLYSGPETAFDREFAMFLSEVWAESHWSDAHIQLPEWSDYRADFSLLNGRVYPDTILPNAPVNAATSLHALDVQTNGAGDLVAPAGHPELQYQPHSSLVRCLPGEKVALRFANLGFREQAMTLAGIPMRVHGRDATPMRGRDNTDTSYETETLNVGPGESYDVIFTAPSYSGGTGSTGQGYDTYMLYNRAYTRANNRAAGGFGGQATEVRVYPSGVYPQRYPNDWGLTP